MLILTSGALLNLILDPLFIIVFGLDVRGAGICHGARVSSAQHWYLLFTWKKRRPWSRVHFSVKFLDWKIIREVLSVGFSALVLPCLHH